MVDTYRAIMRTEIRRSLTALRSNVVNLAEHLKLDQDQAAELMREELARFLTSGN